jgi:hypothetical protein
MYVTIYSVALLRHKYLASMPTYIHALSGENLLLNSRTPK